MNDFWYVIFIRTGFEQEAVDEINRSWKLDGSRPFVPMHEALCFKNSAKVDFGKRRLFPGYIFVESEICGNEFSKRTYNYIRWSKYSIRLLRYGGLDNFLFEMNEKERVVFNKLFNNEHCVGMSHGLIEGDRIIITDGPLVGYESYIERINCHKMQVTLKLEMMGSIRRVQVGLEIVRKVTSPGVLQYQATH